MSSRSGDGRLACILLYPSLPLLYFLYMLCLKPAVSSLHATQRKKNCLREVLRNARKIQNLARKRNRTCSNSTQATQQVTNRAVKRGCNKKLRYREEHSTSVVLSWCTFITFIGRHTTDQQLINHLYETGHETYRILRNNAK